MPEAGSGATVMVLLPSNMTEQWLRDLLQQCPNFDADAELENESILADAIESGLAVTGVPEGFRHQPSIGFDYPGFDGLAQPHEGDTDPEVTDRLSRLIEVLDEAESAYFEGAAASDDVSAPTD